jgi:5'-3' exoribonuclease 1
MGFLVGNDFIPNLPHFHINKGALPLLYSAYMEVLPTLDGYINENGQLNLPRFEKFMERLALIDYENFNDIYADVKWLESRHGRKKLVEVASTWINFGIFDCIPFFYV